MKATVGTGDQFQHDPLPAPFVNTDRTWHDQWSAEPGLIVPLSTRQVVDALPLDLAKRVGLACKNNHTEYRGQRGRGMKKSIILLALLALPFSEAAIAKVADPQITGALQLYNICLSHHVPDNVRTREDYINSARCAARLSFEY